MRFSSAYVLAVAAALASSVSATPTDAVAECAVFCDTDSQCDCGMSFCVSFSDFDLCARLNYKVLWHGSS
ncbi:hypothetical protein P692DRAFT_201793636 [Suillus brevipes Sb2]|nr:hypothetical protein P692DRAFT_201793636 [Suillus brevipes Sb2]